MAYTQKIFKNFLENLKILFSFVCDNFEGKEKTKLICGVEIKFCDDREKPPSLGAFFLPEVLNLYFLEAKYGTKIYGSRATPFLFNY